MTAKTATKKLKFTQPRTKSAKSGTAAKPPEAAPPTEVVTGRPRMLARGRRRAGLRKEQRPVATRNGRPRIPLSIRV